MVSKQFWRKRNIFLLATLWMVILVVLLFLNFDVSSIVPRTSFSFIKKAKINMPVMDRDVNGSHGIIEGVNISKEKKKQACIHTQLDVKDPRMLKYLQKYSPKNCTGPKNWVSVENGTIKFSSDAKKYGNLTCDYRPVLRTSEKDTKLGPVIKSIKDGFQMPGNFFNINCSANGNKKYERLHLGIAYNKALAERPEPDLSSGFGGMSIVILGFDSLSRMSWLRRLPKTREYFHKTLGAIELESHNIVGDGTTAVMFPMLTGKFEWELPECRIGYKGASYMDQFPFLWHDMKRAGYLTAWCNGAKGPFNWRMRGFKEQPTDFYSRPFFLANHEKYGKLGKACLGSQTPSKFWLNWFLDVFHMYKNKRKFLFHFLTEISHDNSNGITTMDEDIKATVKYLVEEKYLNNTLLILMSDHGARFPGSMRATLPGKMEERLPYFSFLFPSWFEKKYPEAIKNLRTNTKRLTTPFDIHETFKDFIAFGGSGKGDVKNRGISLFKEIPLERTCKHADIAPHWCTCLAFEKVAATDENVLKAVTAAVDTFNGYTAKFRKECALLKLANVTSAFRYGMEKSMLKFKHTDGRGGIYKIDLSGNAAEEEFLYQVTFFTTPGGGQFEVTVSHDLLANKFSVSRTEISRINVYGNASACIVGKDNQLKQYCYCNSNL